MKPSPATLWFKIPLMGNRRKKDFFKDRVCFALSHLNIRMHFLTVVNLHLQQWKGMKMCSPITNVFIQEYVNLEYYVTM